MVRMLELSSLRADLSAVEALLANRTKQSDPIGWFQLTERKKRLRALIDENKSQKSRRAAVALYFGGQPVIGSKGIQATFAGKVLEIYQDLIAKRLARKERGENLPDRGRVPGRTSSSLMVTEIARGSFGFVLEETDFNLDLLDSALKEAVADVSDLIYLIGVKDLEDMEEEAEILDNRLLVSARDFFRLLDESGATMRIVTDQRQITLSREQVELGRSRGDTMEWRENQINSIGTLFIVPNSQRFDLEIIDSDETSRGKISNKCIANLRANNDALLKRLLGQRVRAVLIEKEVRSGRDETKRTYTLESAELLEQ